jgi:hypothetical protein
VSHSGSAVTEEEQRGEPIQRRPVSSPRSLQEFPQVVRGVPSLTAIPRQSPDEILFGQRLLSSVGHQVLLGGAVSHASIVPQRFEVG